MKYIRYLLILLGCLITLIIGSIYSIFVIPYRHRARVVVYEYLNKYCKYNPLLNVSTYMEYNPNRLGETVYILDFIRYHLYFWFIWIWLDDTVTVDFINPEDILDGESVVSDKVLDDIQRLSAVCEKGVLHDEEYLKNPNISKAIDDKISLWTIWVAIQGSNNNFINTFCYTMERDSVFLINFGSIRFGWVYEHTYGSGHTYKLVFWK